MCCLPETAGYELSPSDFKTMLEDEIFHNVDCVTISGGEPFMRRDLPEIVSTIREILPNLSYVFTLTNGLAPSLLKKTLKDILLDNSNKFDAKLEELKNIKNEFFSEKTIQNKNYLLPKDFIDSDKFIIVNQVSVNPLFKLNLSLLNYY